jgi:hypothetical protein
VGSSATALISAIEDYLKKPGSRIASSLGDGPLRKGCGRQALHGKTCPMADKRQGSKAQYACQAHARKEGERKIKRMMMNRAMSKCERRRRRRKRK